MKFRGDFQLPDDFQYPTVLNSDEITREVRAMMFAKALRKANLVILDRETVAAAVAVAKGFTPRWTEYECFTQMQDALGGREGAMGESDN